MLFEKNARIVFMGDSITDSGRNYDAKPAGWSSWGDGYVSLINGYTTAFLPDKELMIVNRGINGHRINDLQDRWQKDVMDFKADYVTVKIGVNDVYGNFGGAFNHDDRIVNVETYERIYRELIEQTLPTVKGMILLSPFLVESNMHDPIRRMVDEYRSVVEKLAKEYNLPYGDVQAEIDEFLKVQPGLELSYDRVHPVLAGHVLIAKTWLKAVGIK